METKNISGKIPVELHQRMWEELEQTGMKVSDFLEKVIEEHFIRQEEEMRRKQESNEESRTIAITVPDSFFKRYQRCLEIEKGKHEGRYTNKEFLMGIIQKKMKEIELEAGISQESQEERMEELESVVDEETEESISENPAGSADQEEFEPEMDSEIDAEENACQESSEEMDVEESEEDEMEAEEEEAEMEFEEEQEGAVEEPEEEYVEMAMG